jgi:MoaA/NifB/PqqE/SkfB family radical SAM enzyme
MIESIKKNIIQKYRVDSFVFLEDLENSPSSTLYKTLSPLKKEVFEDNYRFVFFNFRPLNKSTIDHVINTIDYIDIPRFFIHVITNQQSTIDYLSSLDDPVQVQQIDYSIDHSITDNVTPIFNNNNTMCAHAWVGTWVNPNGTVRPCCEYLGTITKSDGIPFNIQTDSIKDILESEYMTELRDQFRKGERPTPCSNCWRGQEVGTDTRIGLSPFRLSNIYGAIDWEGENSLGYIAGHIGNLCNLGCMICSPDYSSTIAAEDVQHSTLTDKKLHPSYKLLKENRWPSDSDVFWDRIKENLPTIKNFEFLGGEPFLLEKNINFMQYLIDNGHAGESVLQISTNGTQFPEVCNSLHKFKKAEITISIDNVEDRFEYERYKSKWTEVIANLKKFSEQRKLNSKIKLHVCVTVNIQNVYYTPELLDCLKKLEIDVYYLNVLHRPRELAITNLTDFAKKITLTKLRASLSDPFKYKLQPLIAIIEQSSGSNGESFCNYISQKDKIRNKNFLDSHKEIGNAMGYIYKNNLL